MKKIVLTSLSALMLSVATAGAAETCSTCKSTDYKIFVGLNGGVAGFNYDSSFKFIAENISIFTGTGDFKLIFPKHDMVYGMEAGMRFGGYKSVWNGGFTLSADKTKGKGVDIKGVPAGFWSITSMPQVLYAKMLKDMRVSTNVYAVTFDNYIRLNKSLENRLDLVAGVGAAEIETNVKLFGFGVGLSAHAAVLKAGLELEVTDSISLTAGTRMYVPVSGQYFESAYAIKGGVKIVF